MKVWIRILSLLMIVLLLVTSFAACAKEETNGDGNDSSTDSVSSDTNGNGTPSDDINDTQQKDTLDPANALVLTEQGRSPYVVVQDDDASLDAKSAVDAFITRISAKTKVILKKRDDGDAATEKEILVGLMDDRAETTEEYARLMAPGGKGYRVTVSESRILVACEEEYLTDALSLLADAVQSCGENTWGIEKDYVGKLDVPDYRDEGELYESNEGYYIYNVTDTSKNVYNGFTQRLTADGFTTYATNEIGESEFGTYVKDSIYGRQVLYTMYHGALNTLRLTWGPLEYLPNAKPIAASDAVTPTITQMYMQMSDNGYGLGGIANNTTGAPGMSYLLQISDGRFIVIDGGNSDGSVTTAVQDENGKWVLGETIRTKDEQRLYDTMCDMMPSGSVQPTVAAWFFSHIHGDHMNLALNFMNTYKGKFTLELVGYNFLAFNDFAHVKTFRERLEANFPEAKTWIMHTGQQLFLNGCEIEVFSTPEDYVCTGKELTDANDGCVVFRVTMGATTFMVLGDAYPTTGEFMRDAYGDALESDILQLAHHGFNGAVQTDGFYEKIDPKICLWPCDEFRFRTDGRNLGSNSPGSDFYMNWWLRNVAWEREDGSSGQRTHYTASYMTTIDANTGKKIP